jgi:predicted acetyltransferase/GrpB-like predicted nucleotidyltransferase (UPF0157 family)
MNAEKLELRTLRLEDEGSFRNAVEEFRREAPSWQFAFGFDESPAFSEYVKLLERHSRGVDVPNGFVPNTFFVGVVDRVVVGRLSLRHSLNDFLAKIGGHIGYGVVPSQRRRGYATEMLRQAIPICFSLGIGRALVTCDEDNVGSRKVVEAGGGIFEGMIDCPESGVPKRRYWIHTAAVKKEPPSQPVPRSNITLTPEAHWRPQVRAVLARILPQLQRLLPGAEIEHIGATAIPGALTKGDLDLMVRVPSAEFQAAVAKLKSAFSVKQPDNWNENFASFGGDTGCELPLGIQLVARNSEADFFVFLRDHFVQHPTALAAYNQLKIRHAGEGPEGYWKAKDRFLSEILAARPALNA